MTIPVSTVPAAQKALSTAIATVLAANSEAEVLLCFGEIGPNAPTDIIEVGAGVRRTPKPSSFVGSGGAGFLEESYDLAVKVSAAKATANPLTDPTLVATRAWLLVAYVETAVRNDPSLGNVVQLAYPSGTTGGEPKWAENNVGRICDLIVQIRCTAVI